MVQVVPFVLMFLDIEVFFPRRLEPSTGGNKSVGSVSGGLICQLFLSSMTLNWMYVCLEVSVSVPVPTLDFDISYSSAILFDDVLI